MKNYRMYLPGFRELDDYMEYSDYSLNARLYLKSEYHESADYIIPVKREKRKRRLFGKRNSYQDSQAEKIVTVRQNSDASSYFKAEFRENQIPVDFNGDYLVPYSYMREKPKTR